jgi:hypothetical protein
MLFLAILSTIFLVVSLFSNLWKHAQSQDIPKFVGAILEIGIYIITIWVLYAN